MRHMAGKKLLDETRASLDRSTAVCLGRPYVSGVRGTHEMPMNTVVTLRPDGAVDLISLMTTENEHEEIADWAVAISRIVLLCFSFANCSNVKLDDVTEHLQPDPRIRRRLKIPDVRRYTLNIGGYSPRPSRNSGEPSVGVMPFHLCRGHFATYTADKPMFGNPKLVGRYWHPPHMKGKRENGEVIKDYAITEAPAQ
jgi:hypothetical protein